MAHNAAQIYPYASPNPTLSEHNYTRSCTICYSTGCFGTWISMFWAPAGTQPPWLTFQSISAPRQTVRARPYIHPTPWPVTVTRPSCTARPPAWGDRPPPPLCAQPLGPGDRPPLVFPARHKVVGERRLQPASVDLGLETVVEVTAARSCRDARTQVPELS